MCIFRPFAQRRDRGWSHKAHRLWESCPQNFSSQYTKNKYEEAFSEASYGHGGSRKIIMGPESTVTTRAQQCCPVELFVMTDVVPVCNVQESHEPHVAMEHVKQGKWPSESEF